MNNKPDPLLPLPTVMYTLPPLPTVARCEPIKILAELPLVEIPVLRAIAPDAPDVDESPEEMRTAPELNAEVPLVITTDPPVDNVKGEYGADKIN